MKLDLMKTLKRIEKNITEKNVLIPNYYSKNGNMTLITALGNDPRNNNKPAFAGNENIEVVRLSKFITSIPDGAFAGCKNLKTVIAPGVTSIGTNAFDGCENLDKFIVSTKVTSLGDNAFKGCPEVIINASNSSVARAATTAGANRVTINVAEMSGEFAEVVNGSNNEIITDYTCGYTIDIGNISYFAFYGGGKTFENVKLISNAQETYLENATFTSDSGVTFKIASPKITFKRVNVKNDNVAILLQANLADILVAEDSMFSALSRDEETKVVTKNIELSNYSGETAQCVIDGTLYIYGNTDFEGKFIAEADEIKAISETEYERYERGSVTVTFNPNGGEVDKTSVSVEHDAEIGALPIPVREGFEFIGWFDESGNQIDATTKVDEDFTVKAHWLSDYVEVDKAPAVAEIKDEKWTYDLTTTIESDQAAVDGYILISSKWSNYGEWSDWTATEIIESQSRIVETKTVTDKKGYTEYSYGWYINKVAIGSHAAYSITHYCPTCAANYYGTSTSAWIYENEYDSNWNTVWTNTKREQVGTWSCNCGKSGVTYSDPWNGHYRYIENSRYVEPVTHIEYRYADRKLIYTHSKIESCESIIEITETENISNIQKWVKYIIK